MKRLLAAFRAVGSLVRRLGGLAAALLLIVLVGGLVVGLVLVRASGGGSSSTAAAPPGLYVGSRDGSVYKLNVQTGALRWSQQVGDLVTGVSVMNGMVYASSGNGKGLSLAALSASSGKLAWTGQITGKYASAPALANGVVCIVSDSLYAFSASNGRLLWQNNDPGFAEVTAADNLVYSAQTTETSANGLYAFDARSGKVRWHVPPSAGRAFSEPVAVHGVVYATLIGSKQGGAEYAFNASNGTLLWQSPLLNMEGAYNPPEAPPLVVGGSLYLTLADGSLIALDTRTGMQLWTYTPAEGEASTNYGGFSSLWVAGQVVYIGEIGHIKALNASDGAVIRQQDVSNYQGSAFIVNGNILYVNSADGVIHALKLTDGSQVWQYSYFQPNQETGFDAAAMVLAA